MPDNEDIRMFLIQVILNKNDHFGSEIKTIGQWLGPSFMAYNGNIYQGEYFEEGMVNIPQDHSWQWCQNVPDSSIFWIKKAILDHE